MDNRNENAMTVLEAVRDLYEGRAEHSHMTGDLALCGKTADDVLRKIKEEEDKR